MSTDSGLLSNTPYTFKMRFENEKGTNPEELVAAAHAACFSMALSLFLGEAGMTAERIQTKATVSLDQVDGGFGDERQDSEREQGRVRQSCRDSENRLSDLQAAQCKITMDAALV